MLETGKDAKVRLFVDQPLGPGQAVALSSDHAHYLFAVMRLGMGDAISLFNGQDGEWRATVEQAGKRGGVALCDAQTAPQRMPPDLWLLFAPIKKARTDFIVEKAVELGAARIVPVQTRHTNSERIRQDRLQAHAVEAAEQCGATHVPGGRTGVAGPRLGGLAERRIVASWRAPALVGVGRALAGPSRAECRSMGDSDRAGRAAFRPRKRRGLPPIRLCTRSAWARASCGPIPRRWRP
jgi:16S rRNA (uracil1498-N3)-methyltransferase